MTAWGHAQRETTADRALAVVPICGRILGYLDRQDLVRVMPVLTGIFECARLGPRSSVLRAVLEVHKFGYEPWIGFEAPNAVEGLPNLRVLSLPNTSHPSDTPAKGSSGAGRPVPHVTLYHRPLLAFEEGEASSSPNVKAIEVDPGALDLTWAMSDAWEVARVMELDVDRHAPAYMVLAAWTSGRGLLQGPFEALSFSNWIDAGRLIKLLTQLSASRSMADPQRIDMLILLDSLDQLAELVRSCGSHTTTLNLFFRYIRKPMPVSTSGLPYVEILLADQEVWHGLRHLSTLAVLVTETRLSQLPRGFSSIAELVEQAHNVEIYWPDPPGLLSGQGGSNGRVEGTKLTKLTIGIIWEERQVDTTRAEEAETRRLEQDIFTSILTPPDEVIQHLVNQSGSQCAVKVQLVPHAGGYDGLHAIQERVNQAFHAAALQYKALQLM